MDNLREEVKKSFQTEMLASGLYVTLGKQYKNFKPNFGEHLKEAGEQEHMHGRIFRKFYSMKYNEELKGEKLWVFLGKLTAYSLRPVPLKTKLRFLSDKEAKAVVSIENQISLKPEEGYLRVLKRILPDEIAHANIYNETFNNL